MDCFERADVPFVIAVTKFDGLLDGVRWALAVAEDVLLATFDARKKPAVRDVLLAVLRNAFDRARARAAAP